MAAGARRLTAKDIVPLLVAGLMAALLAAPAPAAGAQRTHAGVPHVERSGERRYIADEQGNELLLRGMNVNGLIEYPDFFQQAVEVRREDLREMATLGFNFLRLPISWSRLEPRPDRFDHSYLQEIARIVSWAEQEGLRVLIDFHQDRYNRNLRPGDEADGAPDWATLTDGQPCLESFFTSPCSVAALDHFWNDTVVAGKGLQQHYLEALLAVSRRLRTDRRLLGIELMNEPTFGSVGPPVFERTQLWPFYRRLIAGLRADGEQRMIWFGPNILRDVTDFDVGIPERFSDDPNLVYAPHIYTGIFNSGGAAEMLASFAAAESEARIYGAAWVDAEWGGGTDESREAKLALHDAFLVGSGAWMWKQQPGFYDWHTVEVDGTLRDDSLRAQQLSRPHADAVPGELLSTRYEDGRLLVRMRSHGGEARLWSGTDVLRGGPNLLDRPLTEIRIDGRRTTARVEAKGFRIGETALLGFRLSVQVPPGEHLIELLSGGRP